MLSTDDSKYFAAQEAKVVANELIQRGKSFFESCETNGYLSTLKKSWLMYNGMEGSIGVSDQHTVRFTGEQGELTSIFVNHFRNIAQHIYVMITANRPTMEAQAINTDYKSLVQTTLASGILDYYMRQKNLENCIKKATEMCIVMGSGYIKLEWNATDGEQYDFDEETGQFNYEGDINFTNLSPFDVIFDGTKETFDNEWLMTRTYKNKFSLMAKYPELAKEIGALSTKSDRSIYKISFFSNDKTDDIPVYEFFHKRTEALPDGRYILFLENNIILLDTKLPYRTIPVFRIVPNEILGTPYGYTPMFDIYPIQEAINSLYSTILTNQNAFGVQNIFVPRNADMSYQALSGGLNIMEGNEPPVPVNLTSTPKEIFDFLQIMIKAAETISGVNSVARGAPEASLKSGTALALVQSMTLQFISGLQQSYVQLIEDVGTSLINILKDFATTPKIITVVGKNNKSLLKEFTGEDIDSVSRVIVSMGNPLSKCLKKNTPVLMNDGTTKMVQNIIIGDKLMGPDSKPRTVVDTNRGSEMMYDVKSINKHQNIHYGCNENHVLTLKYCSKDGRFGLKQYQEVDMSVKEYLSLSNRHQRLFMGFKTGVEFEKKNLIIPSYILGMWLGDGHSTSPTLTNMDAELITVWIDYVKSLDLNIREYNNGGKASTYFATSNLNNGRNDRNEFTNKLRELNVLNNKHIPFNYLTSNRQDRLELLAGLIDTDGTLIKGTGTFVISQKRNDLSENIVYLSRSLGFRTTYGKFLVEGKEYNKITIGGNTWEIPTKLERKQAPVRVTKRDWLNYGIEVVATGEESFYGFTLEEDPHFLLGDFSVSHNSTAGRIQMVQEMTQMGLITDPQQYFQVLNTGSLDVAYEGQAHELLLIKGENERLMNGVNPLVAPTDMHAEHINEHKSVISDPDLRNNPALLNTVMDHIQDHINALTNTDPRILAITKQQPLPPPQAPGGNPPGPQQPPMPGKTAMGQSTAPGINQPQQGLVKAGEQIVGPGGAGAKMPKVPHPPAPFQNNAVLAKNVMPQ